jgi:hypothetical protein
MVYRLVMLAKVNNGLSSLTFCSSISIFCCWKICLKSDSQQFIFIPLLHIVVIPWFGLCFHIHVCYLIYVKRNNPVSAYAVHFFEISGSSYSILHCHVSEEVTAYSYVFLILTVILSVAPNRLGASQIFHLMMGTDPVLLMCCFGT